MLFVYRSHYEGPLGRRVRRLPDATVLDWFRRGWSVDDPRAWVEAELGGDVYGLSSIFEAAAEHRLAEPQTWEQLHALLGEQLYIEGDPATNLRLDGHALRVRTDDDEVDLAYMFVDDALAAADPQRWAYPLHDEWPLPTDAGSPKRTFATDDLPLARSTVRGDGSGCTYAVFLTFRDGCSFDNPTPIAFSGVRLPDFADRLRRATVDECSGWPLELQVLRTLVAPDEQDITAALDRANRWPGFGINAQSPAPPTHEAALGQTTSVEQYEFGRDPDRSLLHVDEHIAQLAMYVSEEFGYQQWFLFDDVWAASHPDLAESLLRYAAHWDPQHLDPQHRPRITTRPQAIAALNDSIERLYEVFAAYPLHDSTDPCPHCFTSADEQQLRSQPLRQLSADDLRSFAASSLTTWGGVTDLKHFLPRIMEIGATEGFNWPDVELLYHHVAYGEFTTWPAPEVAAMRAFAQAHWDVALHGEAADDAGSVLAAIMFVEPDVMPCLRQWQHHGTLTSLEQLVDFIDANQSAIVRHRRLANAYLRDHCPDAQVQVIGWLIGDALLHHFEGFPGPRQADTTSIREEISFRLRVLHTSLA